jgi:hypothetical protein
MHLVAEAPLRPFDCVADDPLDVGDDDLAMELGEDLY